IREADEAEPGCRDQKMDIGPLVVHVLDPVFGLIVLHPGARHLAAHPPRLAAGKSLARGFLAENPPVVFRAYAVVMETVDAADRALPDRETVRFELGEAGAKARIDVALQDLSGRVDVGIGIVDAETVFHAASPRSRSPAR